MEDGPAKWKLVETAMPRHEVVPDTDCIITHQQFGDCHLHVEFRTLGEPTNSGVFLQDRYEANINETYGDSRDPQRRLRQLHRSRPRRTNAALPPLDWQTFDIDLPRPKFDADGKKTAPLPPRCSSMA